MPDPSGGVDWHCVCHVHRTDVQGVPERRSCLHKHVHTCCKGRLTVCGPCREELLCSDETPSGCSCCRDTGRCCTTVRGCCKRTTTQVSNLLGVNAGLRRKRDAPSGCSCCRDSGHCCTTFSGCCTAQHRELRQQIIKWRDVVGILLGRPLMLLLLYGNHALLRYSYREWLLHSTAILSSAQHCFVHIHWSQPLQGCIRACNLREVALPTTVESRV